MPSLHPTLRPAPNRLPQLELRCIAAQIKFIRVLMYTRPNGRIWRRSATRDAALS